MEVKKVKRYSQYKNSRIQWLGEIPNHWIMLNGKYVFTIINDRSEKGEEELLSVSEHYGVRPRSISNVSMFMAESYKGYKLCKVGDLVINSLWAWSRGLGFSDYSGIVSTAYSVYRPDYTCYNKIFLNYLLRTERYVDQYGLHSKGIWISRLQLSDWNFLRIPILSPPLAEQEYIANYLDKKTEQIDKAIAQKEQIIELLKERKQILINRAVTRGLNPDIPLKDSGVDWIGKVPENWEVTASKHLLTMPITDGPHTTPELFENGIPFISAEAIKNGSIDFEKKRGYISRKEHDIYCLKYKPQRDDIYMIKSGATTGNVAIVETDIEFSIWSPLAVFRADKFLIKPQFLYYSLQAAYFRKGVEISWSYGTQQNIGMGILSNLPIVYCPLDEQASIVDYLKQHLEKIDKVIYQKQEEIEKLKEYKSTLIDSAVTGKICLVN